MNRIRSSIGVKKAMVFFAILSIVIAVALMSEQKKDETTAIVMPIEHIKIEGKFEYLLRSQIRQIVTDMIQGGYFTVDIEAIRDTLVKLPWVEGVSVRRQWPAGLKIAITEKQAIAYWRTNMYLSDKGELFAPEVIISGMKMPQLDGPDGLHKSLWYFLKDTNQQVKELGVFVTRLTLDKRRSWEMQLSNGIVVKLGRDNIEHRLQRFIKIFALESRLEMQHVRSIDLRYPNGFAMRMKESGSDLNKSTLVKEV